MAFEARNKEYARQERKDADWEVRQAERDEQSSTEEEAYDLRFQAPNTYSNL